MSRLIDADALKDGYMNMGYDPNEHPEESYMEGWCKGFNAAVDHCIGHVIYATTIEERKTGKWIFHERREPQFDISGVKTWGVAYKCSECGFIHTVIEDFGHYQFCPNCGSDNREEGDRT